MVPSILEKMGCSTSKPSTNKKKKKKNEPLLLCKERKRFVKQAIDSRCALAAAHVSYTRSLRNIGACLRQYAEAETVPAVASSPSSSYPDDDDDDSVDSPLSHNSNPKPLLSLSYTKSTPAADSTVTFTINPLEEDAMPELSPRPTRPRRPETYSWDYFDTCDDLDSFRLTEIGCENVSVTGLEKSNVEDLNKTEQRKQSCEDGEREDPSEFITHRAKDFVSSMKDIEHKFFRASESGKEVSRMLEANKLSVRFTVTPGKGNSVAFLAALKRACCKGKESHSPLFKESSLPQPVTKVIVWKRTSSSRSSTSRNPLIETPKDDEDDDEESGSDFMQEFCMISGSHSSSLDRLYAWERKLYDEVKASEMIRKEYDRKCEQLRNQFTKDHSAKAMDKTRAAAKDLHSRIRVAIQSVDAISKRIERIRDEELHPQLSEFLQGLIRMWKAMLECHHSQYITISLAYHRRNTSKIGRENALKRRVWSELVEETECFGLSFTDLVNSMTCYVEALNGWLHNCVLLPQERSTRNRRPWSPRRVLAPPIFVLCRDWSAGIKSLPSDELSGSIKEFSMDMEMLGEEKDDPVLVSEDLSSVHSSLAKLLERLKKFSEASLKMYEDVKVRSEEAVVAYANHSNSGRPVM
ncbi:nitrate regulatory gene2 protein [Raphanus sativus]|uniref:Nitrate regulatory gene2 protein n=1 Tax=Raphanus sativus TaxID=3726 RepID=A0A6J0MBV8_RAPSA|nr:nitrate regulatory gene2 protein [Raphanus sativus]